MTPSEIAEKIVNEMLENVTFKNSELIRKIADALDSYAKEKVRECMDNASEWLPNKTATEARKEAFLKAAEISQSTLSIVGMQIAKAIRAEASRL